ncbi:MAG: AI-2E family transporter [Erysipelotrichales bacterium]|nr:AI-2E family transporter [Erysipelotrichales bacterium]
MKKYIDTFNQFAIHYKYAILLFFLFLYLIHQFHILSTLQQLLKIITPILAGVFIAYLFEPMIATLKLKRTLSCIIVYVTFALLVVLIAILLIYPLSIQLMQAKEYILSFIEYFQDLLTETQAVSGISEDTYSMITKGGEVLFSQMRNFTTFLTQSATAFLCALFISLDKPTLLKVFHINKLYQNQHINYFLSSSSTLITRYLIGLGADLLFLFICFSILLYLFSFPSFLLYATLLSLLNMIPILGPTLGFLILLGVSFLYQVPYTWAIVLLVWIIQQIESNYVQVVIFKKTMNVLPIYTLSLLLILGSYFGIIGMIISPILAGMLQIAYKTYELSCSALPTWEDIWD